MTDGWLTMDEHDVLHHVINRGVRDPTKLGCMFGHRWDKAIQSLLDKEFLLLIRAGLVPTADGIRALKEAADD